jgi:hypothetical protein
MLLAGKTIFVAGKSLLLAISATDGAELARCPLDAAPAFDGLAAANGKLYVASADGKVLCFGETK